jgi:Predicted Zn-dependent protease (DUF2268)
MKKLILLLILIVSNSFSQQQKVDSLLQAGNTFYKKKEFKTAAEIWERASELVENKIAKQEYYYYTSMAFAEAKDSTNSFRCLEKSIKLFGYNDLPALKADESFNFMKKSKRWEKIIKSIKVVYTTNPKKVKIIDTDVTNFWKAHDLALKNQKNTETIFKEEYVNKGTIALQYYYVNKLKTIENFVLQHNKKKKYYESIRQNTLNSKKFKSEYIKSFKKLKEIYPEAIFPPIYFVIGKLNSAGTISSDGLILAIDQACMSNNIDISELTLWEKNNISAFDELPYTVAHELIHYEQSGMASSPTLLKAAIEEGMADFIGELISGKTANERLHIYAKGKEKTIWADFKKEMLLNDEGNWIANGDQETEEKPADLGYWVGYQICKFYYDQASDKKKAIHDMLNIQDYEKFLLESKTDLMFNK